MEKFKTPDSGYEPSFGTGTRMRGYGNVESNDPHICLGWLVEGWSTLFGLDAKVRLGCV